MGFDHMDIVLDGVKLRNVEVLADAVVDKNRFLFVEFGPSVFKPLESRVCVSFKVCIVYEVKDGADCSDDSIICGASDDTKEDLFKILHDSRSYGLQDPMPANFPELSDEARRAIIDWIAADNK